MTFVQSLLQDPVSIRNYPTKQVDVLTHDFASEKLEDRIHSLYSYLVGDNEITSKIKSKLIPFKSELEFLKVVNLLHPKKQKNFGSNL
jgi:hypothetical protein